MELDYLVKKLEEQNCIKDYAYLATGDNLDNSSKMAEYYSYTVGVPTLFFILQNKKENIIKRIEHLSNQLYINDKEDLTLEEMKDIIIKMKEEKNIGCVVIDYLRFIHPNNLIPMISHTRFEIKHYFYQLANELNIKIFIQFYPNPKEYEEN